MEIVTDGPTLVLSGDFDARSTWEVRNALRERLHGGPGRRDGRDVVVDLTAVTSMDVTATRVLAYASREASLSGNHVTLRGCGPAVRRMLHLSRLMRFVDVERAAASA
jgi:anti-anti-sigma factor